MEISVLCRIIILVLTKLIMTLIFISISKPLSPFSVIDTSLYLLPQGINLTPMDIVGSSDPYLKVAIGKRKDTTKDNPIKNTLNPIFGKMFEIPATLPYDHTLSITVMDADRMSRDDLIGTTVIDVENRFYSRHRATCGLPQSVTV